LVENGKHSQISKADDWKVILPEELLKRLIGEQKYTRFTNKNKDIFDLVCSNMELIKDNEGQIVGRAAICPYFEGGVDNL